MYETVQYGSGELYGQRGGVSFARAKCTQRGATIADRKVCLTKIIKEGKRGAISPGAGLAIEMETLEACRICRLCGNHSEISINIFDKKAAIIDKIHAVLPISVSRFYLQPSLEPSPRPPHRSTGRSSLAPFLSDFDLSRSSLR